MGAGPRRGVSASRSGVHTLWWGSGPRGGMQDEVVWCGTTSRGAGACRGCRTTGLVQNHKAHLGPGISIFPGFHKSPPHKTYQGLFYPAGAHVGRCFPHLSPSPCPDPGPGGSAPLLPPHRGIFGGWGTGPQCPPHVTAAPVNSGRRELAAAAGTDNLVLRTARPSLFFHQAFI